MTVKPEFSRKQKLVIAADVMHHPFITINEGAVRSGKTFVNNFLWTNHVRAFRGKDHIITGYTMGSIERNVLRPLSEMFDVKITLDKFNSFDYFGNHVFCFGADSYDAFKAMTGLTAYSWYGNEVSLQHANTINEAFNRMSGPGGRIFWDTNPDYPDHPIKIDYIDKSGDRLDSGRLRVLSWHWEIDDNPVLTRDYVENLKKSTPPGPWYDRKIKGLWVGAEGIIYENWNKDVHTCAPFKIPQDWPRFRAIDFGYQHPFVCLWGAMDYDGRIYIYREYYQSQKLISVHAAAVRSASQGENYYFTVSDHDAQERAEYENLDVHTKPADKNVHIGIQHVAERLIVQPDGRPRLVVFNNCPETIRTMGRYQWAPQRPGSGKKEEPLKVDDDPPDCVRYMVQELDGGAYQDPRLLSALSGMRVW
jgi:PBSX family phage terminase large subunit